MSWPDDGNGNRNDRDAGERSPGNTLRHLVKRVTRKFTRTSPSTPTNNHSLHPSSIPKPTRKPFFLRPPSSPRTDQNGLQDGHQNAFQFHGHQLTPNHRSSHSFLPSLPSRRRSTSTPLPCTTAPPKPNLFELTPFPVLPEELVCAILIEAAHDLFSARRLVLVSRQVKWQVQKVLYANVHLGDMTAIRLFARTVWEASAIPRLPELRLGGIPPRAGPEASRERVLDDLREEEESTTTVLASPSSLPSVEKRAATRIRPLRLIRRWSQPPPSPSSSSSSTLPVPPSPSLSLTLPSSTTATPVGSTLTRAFFATTVRALTLVVQEDHFRILFPDVLECARLILCACDAVRELEISGDLIRRTDPASMVAPMPAPIPVPASPSTAAAMAGLSGTGIGPPVLPPIQTMTLSDDAPLPSPQPTAALASAPLVLTTPTTVTPTLQTDLYAARMRPTHLNLLAPHNNVNFHLPMLQHVTHLRYAICPPRILGWRSNNDGSVSLGAGTAGTGAGAGAGANTTGGHALAQTNVAGSMSASNNSTQNTTTAGAGVGGIGATGRGRLLRRLTHVAFDYQIGRESGHGGMGIGVWGAGNFVGIVREALAAGGSPVPSTPLDGGGPLAPHAEDGEGEGNAQGSGSVSGLGSVSGPGIGQGDGAAGASAGGGGTLNADLTDAPDYLDELGEGPPLERVVVKIILRPRAEVLSKFNAIWPRLDALRKSDARLVYFGAKWRDNEMFGENLWERVRAVEERRDRERERVRVRGGGSRQRSNSAASTATAGGGGGGGGRRRASSVSIGWFQDG